MSSYLVKYDPRVRGLNMLFNHLKIRSVDIASQVVLPNWTFSIFDKKNLKIRNQLMSEPVYIVYIQTHNRNRIR